METAKSSRLFSEAQRVLPGGVNSPVRACRSVGCEPRFIKRGEGACLYDVDGNSYRDFVGSWGPMIVGHAHPVVRQAICDAAGNGSSFGAPTSVEVDLAQMVVEAIPSIEKIRFVNSGTEATMSALRLARAATGRKKVIKFDGCYHGHADAFLVKAGSGLLTLGIPGSPGVLEEIVENTLSLPYNDIDALKKTLDEQGEDIACVIVEPVACNMGCVLPQEGFLAKIRTLTEQKGILLIFDEVITGFRLGYGGAQGYYGIMPDLTCLGKIIGGGLPVGAYGGRRDLMEMIAPEGPVYQAGTLSGNPLAMAAGKATLQLLQQNGFYEALAEKADTLVTGLAEKARSAGVAMQVNHIASMVTGYFAKEQVVDFDSATTADTEQFALYYRKMLAQGIYLPPSQFETMFVSGAHTDADIAAFVAAAGTALSALVSAPGTV